MRLGLLSSRTARTTLLQAVRFAGQNYRLQCVARAGRVLTTALPIETLKLLNGSAPHPCVQRSFC